MESMRHWRAVGGVCYLHAHILLSFKHAHHKTKHQLSEVRSGQVRVFNVHACHGHRYRPSPVLLSGKKKNRG